jgi:TRAP-type C4-dicarboxylate transport system permease small subunit
MGPAGYTVVFLLLAGWFAWLMTRMAAFSDEGAETLSRLAVGLALAVFVPLLLLGLFHLVDRLTDRRER